MQKAVQSDAAIEPNQSQQSNQVHLSREQLFVQLQASEAGLSEQEAKKRLEIYGPNEPATRKQTAEVVQLLRLFLNPLVIILLIAAFVAGSLGEALNAAIIATMVLLGVTLNFVQTFRSQRAVERLRAGVAPTATALRNGKWIELPRRLVVPGDIIQLSAGDLVPADALLLQATDLHVQQAALTGESFPVEKTADESQLNPQQLADSFNQVFLGTSIVSGIGKALVTATGHNTTFGDIMVRLAKRPPETEFERGIRHFGLLIMQTIFFLILFVFLIGVAFKHPLFESVLFAIALAVGLTPEFLPMITTVTLGQGAARMAKQKVIVKHLESMQNFGSIDVLCSDKTGTLTTGMMALTQSLDLNGNPSEAVFLYAYLNSLYETGIKSPLDTAIQEYARPEVSNYKKVDEIPFDFERRRLSIVVEGSHETLMITKGAPESILPLCTAYSIEGVQQPFDKA
ncbi:MAG TPA: HAD-IC family P-type ATPase, partial [Ktedonobacteraceae bacterium]|nr:HAD-IC family P-type ATPase [Ktedonobacteraceae bacterium]